MGSSTTIQAPPPPEPVDPGKATTDYINAMADPALQAQLLANEQQFRPGYNQLNLQDMSQYLLGSGGQAGALDLFDLSTQRASQIQNAANSSQRASDIQDVANLGQQATAAFRNANPELQKQVTAAQGLANGGDPYAALRGAVGQPQNYGQIQFNPAQASVLGAAPQAGAQGYSATNAAGVGNIGADQISAQNVNGGLLGMSLYGQALGANGLGQIGSTLQGRGQQFAQSTGQLTPDELRTLQQSVREGYAARGTEMGSGSISAEALSRLTNERQRMQEDLGMASAINAQNQSELDANRGFQQSVQGQELGRQFQNQSNSLYAQSQNQGANLSAAGQNQQVAAQQAALNQAAQNTASQYGASAANQASQFNASLAGQYGMANQAAQNQYGLYNSQAGLATQDANRAFAAQQGQQNISNLGLLGQMDASQLSSNRAYALQLAQMQASIASDPFQAILGRTSGALQYGAGQQGFAGNLTQSMQGPQLFDPNAGINLALMNNSNLSSYNNAIFGAQAGASGASAAANGQMVGAGLGAAATIGAAAMMCWVAREVYTPENPRWLTFRYWLLNKAPRWFFNLYARYGERFAAFISNKPTIKNLIRRWMDSRIATIS